MARRRIKSVTESEIDKKEFYRNIGIFVNCSSDRFMEQVQNAQ